MILIIRISGLVEMSGKVEKMLQRLRLRRKYSAVLLPNTKENASMLKKVRNFVAYGTIEQPDLLALIQKRGKSADKRKIDAAKIAEIIQTKGVGASGIKPFFRLHPPRGGIESKVHFPIRGGVLGDHGAKINELLRRML